MKVVAEFPTVHFLRKDAEDALVKRLVNQICGNNTSVLPTNGLTQEGQTAIKHFISEQKVNPEVTERVMGLFPEKPELVKRLFLLRGLFVNGILLLCLKRRWNVQYGLHPNRDPIAVPFHAKGVPSEHAEWGHPDVAILFTCLAFYYTGLTLAQLGQGINHLLRSDDPSSEYDRWTQASISLPDSLRFWNVINPDDYGQIQEMWSHLRFNVIVIDYYLNQFVFPNHAKQFSRKLQASGWDVPLFFADENPSTTKDTRIGGITTGFSGTNDNKTMLPLTVRQEDLPGLSHTNAEVLTYLLQPRNRSYILAANVSGKHLTELELLNKLHSLGIRILIDAGAYILEMDNRSLVKAWLEIDYDAQGAVYFDAGNKAWVLYKNGRDVPLLASSFNDNFSKCLVYLDEVHTRGTDLNLPGHAHGALTLGLGQTKDHTVQGLYFIPIFRKYPY
jgi:hypothetical protein